jgi:hypothetical protein
LLVLNAFKESCKPLSTKHVHVFITYEVIEDFLLTLCIDNYTYFCIHLEKNGVLRDSRVSYRNYDIIEGSCVIYIISRDRASFPSATDHVLMSPIEFCHIVIVTHTNRT